MRLLDVSAVEESLLLQTQRLVDLERSSVLDPAMDPASWVLPASV